MELIIFAPFLSRRYASNFCLPSIIENEMRDNSRRYYDFAKDPKMKRQICAEKVCTSTRSSVPVCTLRHELDGVSDHLYRTKYASFVTNIIFSMGAHVSHC